MAYLSSIVSAIEKSFNVSVKGDYYGKTLINGIRFITDSDTEAVHLEPTILYLADYQKFGSASLRGNLLYVNCGDAIPQNNAVYIQEDLGLTDVYNTAFESVFSYQRIQNEKLTLFAALHADSSIEKLLHAAYARIGNPIVVLDSSYTILSYYPDLNDVFSIEERNNHLYLNADRIIDMKEEKIINTIAHSVYPFVTRTRHYSYDMVFQSIRVKNSIVGYVCILCRNRSLTEDELEYVYTLTQMISIQFQRNDGYRNIFGYRQETFLKDLLLNHFADHAAIEKELTEMGVKPKEFYYIVCCGFTEQVHKLLGNNYYCLQLSVIFPNALTSIYGNHFITLVPCDSISPFTQELTARLEAFLTLNHMKATISYVFRNLAHASSYFSQCLNHISHYLVTYSESPIAFYSEHFLRHLVELSKDYKTISSSIHPSIQEMYYYDRKNKTDYIKTLRAYIKNNRSAPAAAKALFIHKSTLFYRFDKMKELFNITLDDSEMLFAYEYSIRILEILKD